VLLEEEIESFDEEIVDGVENFVEEELRIQIQRFENRIALAHASFHSRQILICFTFPKFETSKCVFQHCASFT
jgi:hypothetical protein